MSNKLPESDKFLWWNSLRHNGLMITPSKIIEYFSVEPEPLRYDIAERLRSYLNLLKSHDGKILSEFVDFFIEKVLGLGKENHYKENSSLSRYAVKSLTGEMITPNRIWKKNSESLTLSVFIEPDNKNKDFSSKLGVGKSKRFISRVIEWLRKTNNKIAIATNGFQWRLIYAGEDYDSWCESDISLWLEEGNLGLQITAFRTLLSKSTLVFNEKSNKSILLSAIDASRQGQSELSDEIGENVRKSVELLIKDSAEGIEELLKKDSSISTRELYIAATRVIMRCVFILFAESRELLPRYNPIYHSSYSIQGLFEQLEKRSAGKPSLRLKNSYSAWARILALFNLVYEGSPHEALPVPKYSGNLFKPGDIDSENKILKSLTAFETIDFCPSDEIIYYIIQLLSQSKMKIKQGKTNISVPVPVDFSDLSSEYIGILYEGLLDFELKKASENEPMIFLNIGNQPILPLDRLESMDDSSLSSLLQKFKKDSKIESEEESEEEEIDDEVNLENEATEIVNIEDQIEATDEIAIVRKRAIEWAKKAVEMAKFVPKPKKKDQESQDNYNKLLTITANSLISKIVMPNEWYLVRWGGTRKGSGTFYTRPQLVVPLVKRTLTDLVYNQSEDNLFTPKRPEEILNIKICEPSMGSGSFLVASLRFLTNALFESLHYHDRIKQHGSVTLCKLADGVSSNSFQDETLPLPKEHPDFEDLLKARLKRYLVERCLYGVDLDPLAVELSKLALWIETMDRNLSFGFLDHKLKCGNSLVGCWFDRFQDYPFMAWEREGGDKSHKGVHFAKEEWTKEIKRIKDNVVKPELKNLLETLTPELKMSIPQFSFDKDVYDIHSEAEKTFNQLHEIPLYDNERREEFYQENLEKNQTLKNLKFAFDTWCSVWFWNADKLDISPTPEKFYNPSQETVMEIKQLKNKYRFFHWELEFPDVFTDNNSGFDAVIGNPPWDIAKPSSQEFFSNIDPLYRTYGKQEAVKCQNKLFEDKKIEKDWLEYNLYFKSLSNWLSNVSEPFGSKEKGISVSKNKSENIRLNSFWRERIDKRKGYSGKTHLFSHQGSADSNFYKLFLEISHYITRENGTFSMIVPSGLYTDKGTKDLRTLFLDNCRWKSLFSFINWNKIFTSVYYRFKFCIVIVQKGGKTQEIKTAFGRYNIEDWENAESVYLNTEYEQIKKFSPIHNTFLEFRDKNDLELATKLYSNAVLFGEKGVGSWNIDYSREFDMTNDSALFPPLPDFIKQGFIKDEYGNWLKGIWTDSFNDNLESGIIFSADKSRKIKIEDIENIALPFYEGRMIGQFDFSEKGWVNGKGRKAEWREISFENKTLEPQFLMEFDTFIKYRKNDEMVKLSFLGIGSSTNSRSMISSCIDNSPCGNSVPTLISKNGFMSNIMLLPIVDSYCFDSVLRCRLGGLNINYFVIEETPLLPLSLLNQHKEIIQMTSSLCFPNIRFSPIWLELLEQGYISKSQSWKKLWAVTDYERTRLTCILNAVIGELYGLDLKDAHWIFNNCDQPKSVINDKDFMRTLDPKGFWRVDKNRDPELRHTVLSLIAFHELKKVGLEAFLKMNDGDGWMLPEQIKLSDYGLGHDQRANEYQPIAEKFGERFLDWQLNQDIDESWEECQIHADNLKRLFDHGISKNPIVEQAEDNGEYMFWNWMETQSEIARGK